MSRERRVCLVRFHDGTAKPNWGGRATSLALGRVIDRAGRHLASVVNGDYIVRGLDIDPRTRQAAVTVRRLARRARLPVAQPVRHAPGDWADLPSLAARVAANPPSARARAVVDALEAADEVWVNGEGDLILTERTTLYRTLLITHMAASLGRPVHMTNSILSAPPDGPPVPWVVEAVGAALARCELIAFRDPASLRLHRDLYPDLEAGWQPDALFAWAGEARRLAAERVAYGPATEGLAVDVQSLLRSGAPYVAISGSSARFDREEARRGLAEFVTALRRRGLAVVVVLTDKGDAWMAEEARRSGVPVVPASVPLATGLVTLARAACFVSGRYHPSIMAANGGTPCVMMRSNSHKTSSLQEVLGTTQPVERAFLGGESVDDIVAATSEAIAVDRAGIAATAAALCDRLGAA